MQAKYDEVTIDYSKEIKDDSILEVAKQTCYLYLENNKIKYSIDELEYLLGFCSYKFSEITKLKSQMQIKDYSNLSLEISSSLDKITLGDSIVPNSTLTEVNNSLNKDVNNILCQLRFCIGVLSKIIESLDSKI